MAQVTIDIAEYEKLTKRYQDIVEYRDTLEKALDAAMAELKRVYSRNFFQRLLNL